ncbi:Predicted membrane protein [Paramagnetospirillum magneticum AMB-1]|uniref:Predicted membrane protein n=2 Tax=Paramagnetospirillum magneticum TaxID=84159 RepID=Q2W3P3_PARM1|nr:Predicted membrane protein [Paramagnetospirillum magneticum AMB-1]
MLIIYFGFIAVIAFNKAWLGTLLTSTGVMTIGFPIGVGVILSAIALTGIYVYRANGEFDDMNRQILEDSR